MSQFYYCQIIFNHMTISYVIYSIECPPIDGHLDCFCFLTVMNNAAMNAHVPVFVNFFVNTRLFTHDWVGTPSTKRLRQIQVYFLRGPTRELCSWCPSGSPLRGRGWVAERSCLTSQSLCWSAACSMSSCSFDLWKSISLGLSGRHATGRGLVSMHLSCPLGNPVIRKDSRESAASWVAVGSQAGPPPPTFWQPPRPAWHPYHRAGLWVLPWDLRALGLQSYYFPLECWPGETECSDLSTPLLLTQKQWNLNSIPKLKREVLVTTGDRMKVTSQMATIWIIYSHGHLHCQNNS